MEVSDGGFEQECHVGGEEKKKELEKVIIQAHVCKFQTKNK